MSLSVVYADLPNLALVARSTRRFDLAVREPVFADTVPMTRTNTLEPAPKLPRLKTGWLLWTVLGLALVVRSVTFVTDISENDVFLHTLMGQWILNGGAITGNPNWTYAPYEPGWVNTLVVPEIVFACLHSWFGWGGIALVRVIAVAVAAVASWFAIGRFAPTPSSRHRQLAGVIGVVGTLAYIAIFSSNMSMRPQALSFAVIPLLTLALVQIMQLGRFPNIILVGVATWAWTCWHGYGALVGPLFLLAAAVHLAARTLFAPRGQRIPVAKSTFLKLAKQSATPLVAIAVTFLTPAGAGLWTSAGRIKEASVTLISEWQPTLSVAGKGGLGLAITVLAVLLWIGAALPQLRHIRTSSRGTKLSVTTDVLFIVLLLAVLFSTERTAVLGASIIMFIALFRATRSYLPLAYKKAERQPRSVAAEKLLGPGRHSTRIVGGVALALLAITLISVKIPAVSYSPDDFPQDLVQQIAAQPGQHRVFTEWDVSSDLLYQMQASGNGQTAFDGRTDYYGADTLTGIGMLDYNTPQWDSYFAPYVSSTDALIKTDTETFRRLVKAGWTVQDTQIAGKNRLTHEPTTWAWLAAPKS